MRLAATGHRPNKLTIGASNGYHATVKNRLVELAKAALVKFGATEVISGMALGWDMAIAIAARQLELPLIAAIPFANQPCKWNEADKLVYDIYLREAEEIIYVDTIPEYSTGEPIGEYSAKKMQKRNEWMVDNCGLLLALYDGSNGGTANCVRYAESKGVRIVNVWNSWEKFKCTQTMN